MINKIIKQTQFNKKDRKVIVTFSEEGKDDYTEVFLYISHNDIMEKISKSEPIEYNHVYIEKIQIGEPIGLIFETNSKDKNNFDLSISIKNSICAGFSVNGYNYLKSIYSYNTIFNNYLFFNNTTFSEVINFVDVAIESSVRFESSEFNGGLFFQKSVVADQLSISFVKSNNTVSFNEVIFKNEICLFSTFFGGITSFNKCIFKNWTRMIGITFFGQFFFTYNNLSFSDITKYKLIDFNNSKFYKDGDFIENELSEEVKLDSVYVFEKLKFSKNCINKKTLLSFKSIKFTNGSKNKIEFIDSDLSTFSFLYSDMSLFDFTQSVTWGKKGNRIVLWDEEEIKNKSKDEKGNLYRHLETLYRQLKCKHLDLKDYKTADAFMASEYEMSRRAHRFPLFTWEIFYKLFSNYGMNWWLPLTWIAGSLLTCSLIIQSIENWSFFEALSYNFYTLLLIKQEKLMALHFAKVPILAHIGAAFNAAMLLLSAFAIKRKFRT